MITLTIPGPPVGKQRARVVRSRAGFPVAFTPAKTKNYETLVRELFALKYPGFVPLDDPVEMELDVFLPIPKSASRRRRELMATGAIRPAVRPDLSNVLKSVEDALNGVAYRDDSMIVHQVIKKQFAYSPRVELRLKPFVPRVATENPDPRRKI